MESAAKAFFANRYFAVAGASQAPDKFGYKILAWYHDRKLAVTPINPTRSAIEVKGMEYPTVPSPTALPHPTETSLSLVTPPAVTKTVLKEAKASGLRMVWLQPGTFDAEILDSAKKDFDVAIGGLEGETQGHEGWCVLVDGPQALESASRL